MAEKQILADLIVPSSRSLDQNWTDLIELDHVERFALKSVFRNDQWAQVKEGFGMEDESFKLVILFSLCACISARAPISPL